MAQLKDTLIQGSARVTDTLYVNTVNTNILNADNLETNLLKINTSATDASLTTVGINLTNDDTINAHIGTSTSLGMYAAGNIIMRPGGATGNSTEGMVLSTGALNPKDNTLTLGSASNRWKSLYTAGYTYIYGNNQWCLDVYIYNKSKTQVGEIYYNSGNADNVTTGQYSFRQWSPKATPDTGTSGYHETYQLPAVTAARTDSATYSILTSKSAVTVAQGGTGKASWTQWGVLYASASTTLAQVAAGANTYYNNKFQVLTSNGAAAPIWKTALLMQHDMPTLASLSITNINSAPTGVSRTNNSTESGAITNIPVTSCGGMIYTLGGYNGSADTYKWQLFLGADYNRSFIRHMDGSTWGSWYRMPRISGTVDTAIGGTKTPVYVSTSGEIVAGTAIKALAYKDSLTTTDIPTISITDKTSGTLTVARGGTGATTAADARTNLGLGSVATYNISNGSYHSTNTLIPTIRGGDGVMEIGKYIDFHVDAASTKDYDARITASATGLTLSGTTSGTFSGSLTGNASSATKIAAKLAATTKTYLLGTSTTITGTAANVELIGDTGVYLTTTSGELSAVKYSINSSGTEKINLQYNTTTDILNFVFV